MNGLRLVRRLGRGVTGAALRTLTGAKGDPRWGLRTELLVSTVRQVLHDERLREPSYLRGLEASAALRSGMVRQARYESVDAGGVAARWCRPPDAAPGRALVYFHGGGFVIGSLSSHADIVARLAVGAGVACLAVDYRLAPEHRYPAAHDDAFAAYRWLLEVRGFDPSRVVLAGDSAGGNLVVATLLRAREAGLPQPAAAVLISPLVEFGDESGSMVDNAGSDLIDLDIVRGWHHDYAPDRADWSGADLSPARAPLEGLAPMLVQAAGREILIDQIRRFVAAADAAGNDVRLDVAPHMFHDYQVFATMIPEGRPALEGIVRFVRQRLRLP